MPKPRVTMADVADEVGVSMMTVSRVINNKGDVSAQTAERVWDAVERLAYRPSSIARGLATQQTKTIGLVVPDVGNPFFSDIARGVASEAYAAGYSVFLCNAEEDAQRELAVLLSLEDRQVDGLMLCSSRLSDQEISAIAARVSAMVLINRRVDDVDVLSVSVDDHSGSRRATDHLIAGGHQRIGFLAGPTMSASGRQRLKGYHEALDNAGIQADPRWIRACAPQVTGAQETAAALLTAVPELSALLCYNDLVAVGALRACTEAGIDVPSDLAVVGFDDILLAELVTPALTTCRVPRGSLGRCAMSLLLAQLAGEPINERVVIIRPELIIRESAPSLTGNGLA